MPSTRRYFAADAAGDGELARLKLLESIGDPTSFRCLNTIGVGPGWRCLEVGPGAGSVTRWLAARVGATGRVVAADLDPRFLADLNEPNVEVRQCDITSDEIESGSYDLVHARAVIMHMQDPLAVLRRLSAMLRPGGWLMIEDPDYGTVEALDSGHPLAAAFDECYRARAAFLSGAGIMDLRYGHRLPRHMDALGLVDADNEACTRFDRGGSVTSRFWRETWLLTDGAMVDAGVITRTLADDCARALDDPTFVYRGALICVVWGRAPVRV